MAHLVAVIDYGSGNVQSVVQAFKAIDCPVIASKDWQELQGASHLVLPGVGAFAHCMEQLRSLDLIDSLNREVLEKGKPFLGICVGHQLMANLGKEFGNHEGMGWFAGEVERIDNRTSGLRLPHVGWNNVEVAITGPLYRKMSVEPCFYFVHSYHFVPEDAGVVSGRCEYNVKLTASIQKDNIFGVQFHPEKSQSEGLQLLHNFAEVE